MLTFVLRRLMGTLVVLLTVSVFVFGFVRLLPGDPARLVAGPDATLEDVAAVRAEMGLDGSLFRQYIRYLGQALRGDLGRSARTRQPVVAEIGQRFMPTLWLTLAAMGWATIAGLAIGVISGVERGRWIDQTAMVVAVSGVSFPSFWLGLLLIDLFSVRLGWLPTGGDEGWRSFVLPSLTLGAGVAAVLARFTRSAFVEVAGEDYVRTARAKGLGGRPVIRLHALPNALLPVITLSGILLGFVLAGSIPVERAFGTPGLGYSMFTAVAERDIFVMQNLVFLYSVVFVLLNIGIDLLIAWLDPRIRYQ
jgi:glutathione transport system permease protein